MNIAVPYNLMQLASSCLVSEAIGSVNNCVNYVRISKIYSVYCKNFFLLKTVNEFIKIEKNWWQYFFIFISFGTINSHIGWQCDENEQNSNQSFNWMDASLSGLLLLFFLKFWSVFTCRLTLHNWLLAIRYKWLNV